jgi:pimeloyl-ACP methyl ester carboxylesterase
MVPPPVVRHTLTVAGVRVSYLSPEPNPDGAPPVVLIHGSGVSARYWRDQLEGLADVARVLALDLPGHGESDPIPNPDLDADAQTVGALVQALGLAPAVLVGHSLGAAVAVTLAARRPALARALVLLAACGRLPPSNAALEQLFAWLPGPLRRVVFFATAKRLLFAPGAAPDVVRLAMEEIRSCRLETLRRDIAAARAMDVHALAATVEVPTLVIVGSRDALTPPALAVALGEAMPHARVCILEGAGHMVHLEAPGRVNDEIRALLGGLPAGAEAGPRRPGLGTLRRLARRAIGWLRRPGPPGA